MPPDTPAGPTPATRLRAAGAGLLLAACAWLASCGGGGGGSADGGDPPLAYDDPVVYSGAPGASLASATEAAAVTHHTLRLGGHDLAYTATAGHLTARALVGDAPLASMFYVAYTLDGADPATRPVTVFYNGGPGSASVWLHLGSFGPRRLATGAPSTTPVKPFPLVDNAESLLDATDLVFVDAVGAGLSEAIAPHSNLSFWGVDADADVFRDTIRRWLALNQRSASPLFIFGESYGTLRSAVLAERLESAGVPLAGVVLQSSILDYNSNCAVFSPGSTDCTGYLPSYAAVGTWFGLTRPVRDDLGPFLGEMRSFAEASYHPAVVDWLDQGLAPDAGLLGALVADTGLAQSQWQLEFSLGPDRYQRTLIDGQITGRYDARMAVATGSPLAREGDPSSTVISDEFARAIRAYLPGELGYGTRSSYATTVNAIDHWDFGHDGHALPDGVPDLAAAMTLNPDLRVLSLSGVDDLATPFYQTERDLARLPALAGRFTVRTYVGGHMTYLDDASRAVEKADLAAFYQAALAAGAARAPEGARR
ncbi:MAG: peptidase S10 [Burkholderiaceae bacterium]